MGWRDAAGCAGISTELFYTEGLEADALEVCDGCPDGVRAGCLEVALVGREAGVWGGTTEGERAVLVAALRGVRRRRRT